MVSEEFAFLRADPRGCVIAVKAQPGASRTGIAGVFGSGPAAELRVRVSSPTVDGAANEALMEFLATIFGVKTRFIELLSGQTSRSKRCLLVGINVQDAATILKSHL